eukprot:566312_1
MTKTILLSFIFVSLFGAQTILNVTDEMETECTMLSRRMYNEIMRMARTGNISQWNDYARSDDGFATSLVFESTFADAGAYQGLDDFLDSESGYAPSVVSKGVFSTAAVSIMGMNVEYFPDDPNGVVCGLYPVRNVLIRGDGTGIKEDEINQICFDVDDFKIVSHKRITGSTESISSDTDTNGAMRYDLKLVLLLLSAAYLS